ncbi:MAG: hypothetical protein IIC72_12025 [Acidobacteria bacterium]|nr:hypothetical protein [Acidobacteriota bacterium]
MLTSIGKKRPFLLATVAALALTVLAPLSVSAHDGGDPVPAPAGSAHLVKLGQFDVPINGLTSDVWALGNYAYLGSFSSPFCSFDITGVRIIDISDPTDPQQVAFIKDKQGTRTNDVKAASLNTSKWSGDILVSTNEGCGVSLPRLNADGNAAKGRGGRGGINIYDVTDPTKPHALKQNFLPKANGIHNTYIWEDGDGNAYLLAVDDVALADVIVVDITNPASPKEIARTGQEDWPSDIAAEIEGPSVFLHDVWVQDGIAYLSYWDAGLVLLDVSDPSDPQFISQTNYWPEEEGDTHVAVPARGGNLVITGDEDFSPDPWGFMRVFDSQDEFAPVQVGTYDTGNLATPPSEGDFSMHNVIVRGNTAYVSWYSDGIQLVDISQPSSPRGIGSFIPEAADDPFGILPSAPEMWGVYVQGNLILGSDMNSGLHVLKTKP